VTSFVTATAREGSLEVVKIGVPTNLPGIGRREMPYKEEDEGYFAAETGQGLSENPYPRGTIRHDHWRRGWQIKCNETHKEEHEGYLASETGHTLLENPYSRGTIRFDQWQRGWHVKNDEAQRVVRSGRT
jgi:hypothetical protein